MEDEREYSEGEDSIDEAIEKNYVDREDSNDESEDNSHESNSQNLEGQFEPQQHLEKMGEDHGSENSRNSDEGERLDLPSLANDTPKELLIQNAQLENTEGSTLGTEKPADDIFQENDDKVTQGAFQNINLPRPMPSRGTPIRGGPRGGVAVRGRPVVQQRTVPPVK